MTKSEIKNNNENKFEMKQVDEKNNQMAVISVVIITAFITTFSGSALNLSVPDIGMEFNISASMIGWIVTAYILTSAILSVPFGRLADILGRKGILVFGILTFALCSLLAALSKNAEFLIFVRAMQGFGAAMIFSTNTAVLISAFPASKRGKVLGYSIAATYIGLSAGPVIGGLLNHYFGWRSIFLATSLASMVAFAIAALKLPVDNKKEKNTEGKETVEIDFKGIFLYVCMLSLLMVGLSTLASFEPSKYMIVLGLILIIVFVKHELKTIQPIIKVRLFANNLSYTFSNLAALLNYGATFGIGYLLSIYLQVVMGFESDIAGLIMISQPLIMAIVSPYAGKLSDRVSPFKLSSIGMALCALGIFSFIFISEDYPLTLIIINLIVVGVGFGIFSSPNTNAVMACVDKSDYSVASSFLATMRSIGHSMSMVVVTFIVSKTMGKTTLSQAEPSLLIETMHISFIIFGIVCLIGILISMKRKTV